MLTAKATDASTIAKQPNIFIDTRESSNMEFPPQLHFIDIFWKVIFFPSSWLVTMVLEIVLEMPLVSINYNLNRDIIDPNKIQIFGICHQLSYILNLLWHFSFNSTFHILFEIIFVSPVNFAVCSVWMHMVIFKNRFSHKVW